MAGTSREKWPETMLKRQAEEGMKQIKTNPFSYINLVFITYMSKQVSEERNKGSHLEGIFIFLLSKENFMI